jgi:N-methylhydantoinase A
VVIVGSGWLVHREGASARLAVDIGGTFTDVVVETGRRWTTAKVLTTPAAPEGAVLQAIEQVLHAAGLRPGDVELVIHGTTLATNAVIERKGAVTALITTEGFRDVLAIADESRFDQYDINLVKTAPLIPRERRLTVPERVRADGGVLLPLDEAAVVALVPVLRRLEVESVAIGFLHSYANPTHEQRCAEILHAALPELWLTLSSEVCPEIREYERFTTASANAYVQPRIASYLGRLERCLAAAGLTCPLFLMTSGGGLMTVAHARREPIRLIESGPAGGAILAARIAAECGLERVLSFDMGGTTAKICLIDDFKPDTARHFEIDRQVRFVKGSGLPLRIPVIEMVEIGAGGGSIARVDATRRITVGPASAGSEPGPACYARGGEAPTVTDADVALGRIDPKSFAGGRLALDVGRAEEALQCKIGAPLELDPTLAAFGVAEVVDETMANAARVHAVERGADVADRTLIAFGGAAPIHAARLAEKLGIRQVLVPTAASVGSADGFLRAPAAYQVVRSLPQRLSAFDPGSVNAVFAALEREALAVVSAAAPAAILEQRRTAYMRYVGQGHEVVADLPVRRLDATDRAVLQATFDDAYRKLYGRLIPGLDVEVLSFGLDLTSAAEPIRPAAGEPRAHVPTPAGTRQLRDPAAGVALEVPVYWRPDLAPGATFAGPAIIAEDDTTILVSSACGARVDGQGHVWLERHTAEAAP